MKKEIILDYSKTGIVPLKVISWIVLILGIISYVALVYLGSSERYYSFEFNWIVVFSYLPVLIGSFFFFALGLCVSTLTKNSMLQRVYLLEKISEEYIVKEKTPLDSYVIIKEHRE